MKQALCRSHSLFGGRDAGDPGSADVQEYHLPIYHTLSSMLEAKFFSESSSKKEKRYEVPSNLAGPGHSAGRPV